MKSQHFVGTRGDEVQKNINFKFAILNPNASFGGLYTLRELPKFSQTQIDSFAKLDYKELTKIIFSYLNLEVENLDSALSLYDSFDDKENPAPLFKAKENLWIQKLYCGPTRAFKDMALQPFGSVFSAFAKDSKKEYLILVATSGDTGPATLKSFANKEKIKVVCLYPNGGTSDVQRLQMTSQNAKNIKVFGIEGNFDDAQNALKNLLKDEYFHAKLDKKNIALSAANSVNFGRIAFQILYHIKSSLEVYKQTQKEVQIIVPSGNFGNALGAFYAKMMGFPIKKIWIASNINNILTEFITTGIYDISHKNLQKTLSPAMDILKSSNVERMLFALFGEKRTRELMERLEKDKKYSLKEDETKQIQEIFGATFCDDEFCLEGIRDFAKEGNIIDPHTACGLKAYQNIDKNSPCIICSTAEWTKFAPSLAKAFGKENLSDKEALDFVAKHYHQEIPNQIAQLFTKEEIHKEIITKENIKQEILNWL